MTEGSDWIVQAKVLHKVDGRFVTELEVSSPLDPPTDSIETTVDLAIARLQVLLKRAAQMRTDR